MYKIAKLSLIFIVSLFFTGCITKIKEVKVPVVKKEFIKVTPDDSLITIYDVPTPPNREIFINNECMSNLKLLTEYNKDLLLVIKRYRKDMNNLYLWKKNVHDELKKVE